LIRSGSATPEKSEAGPTDGTVDVPARSAVLVMEQWSCRSTGVHGASFDAWTQGFSEDEGCGESDGIPFDRDRLRFYRVNHEN
jgi:hypothetical protein